jgi:hypothetical protein
MTHRISPYQRAAKAVASRSTSNVPAAENYRSPDDIMRAVMEFARGPRLIGNLMGVLVYVDGSLPPGEIEFRHGDGRVQRVSIDHPYLQGTKLRAEAMRALGEQAPETKEV